MGKQGIMGRTKESEESRKSLCAALRVCGWGKERVLGFILMVSGSLGPSDWGWCPVGAR